MKNYDLIIIGAGPAGLTLAWKVAEKGYSVLVLDKKSSASDVAYLTAGSRIDFKEWDLPKKMGHPLKKLYFSSKNEYFIKNGSAFMINRRVLLKALEKKARKNGVELKYSSTVNKVDFSNKEIDKIIYSGKKEEFTAKAKFFADCSGVGRVFERYYNILGNHKVENALGIEYIVPLKSEPHTLDLYVGSHYNGGYGWLCPLNKKQAILGYGTFNHENFPKLKSFIEGMFELERVNERVTNRPIEVNSGLLRTGAPLKKFTRENLILVGDVALQANPLVGEGVRFVMDSARMASAAIENAIKKDKKRVQIYDDMWIKKYYKIYSMCYKIQKVLRIYSCNDKIVDASVRCAKKFPDKMVHDALWHYKFDRNLMKAAFKEVIMSAFKK